MSGQYVTISSETFLGGLGVDTHIPYTDGAYSTISLVTSELQYLGIDNVRDSISDGTDGSAPISSYIELAKSGVHFTFLISNQVTNNAGIEAELAEYAQVEAAVPGSIIAIEGPNEINNWPVTFNGTGGLAGAIDFQEALYADVKSDPALSGVAVDYFTGWGAGNNGLGPWLPTTPGLADYDTQHPYPNYNQPPAFWVSRAQALPNTEPGAPAVFTETGYSTDNVSPYVQEVYTLDLLMDTAEEGISQTYLYQLMDAYVPGSRQGDDGYGLFYTNGSPKPAAVGIHNLTSILNETIAGGADQPPAGIGYAVENMPSDGNSMMIIQPDTADDIVIWAEPYLWNDTTNTQVKAPTEYVTVSLDAYYGTLALFDPTVGTTALETWHDAQKVTLAVTDHPIILQISGGDPPPPGGALCFVTGTAIRTPAGEVAVELLAPGDLVATAQGPRAIKWIGRRSYEGTAIAANPLMLPVCIRRGALAGAGYADAVPCRDLWVSPGHGIWIDNHLIPAWRLANGESIIQAEAVPRVDYLHIELAEHGILFAENCPAESFFDNGTRDIFDNAASYQGQSAPTGPALPRLEDGFLLQHIQHRLAARAGLTLATEPALPSPLRGFVDLAGPHLAAGWAQCAADPDVPVSLDILLDGSYLATILANRYRPDVRHAGFGSGLHGFEFALPRAGRVEIRRAADQSVLPKSEACLAAV